MKVLLGCTFSVGAIFGVWMLLDASPVQTLNHTIELKHSWVRLELAATFFTLMFIATVFAHRIFRRKM
jgi:hypothetical protein